MNTATILPPTITHLRLIAAMPDDHEDSRSAPTMAPDAVRDTEGPDTEPPGSADVLLMHTMIPPADGTPKLDANGLVEKPSNMPELLYNQLMKVHQAQAQRDHDLLDADGVLAKRAQRNVEEFGAVVERIAGEPMRELAQVLGTVADDLRALRTTVDEKVLPQLERHDRAIGELKAEAVRLRAELVAARAELLAATKRIDELENQAHDAAPPAPASQGA